MNLSVILFFIGLWMYARYWRKMCGKAFCQYAAACCGREEREKLMRYAIIAGNRHATLLYALTYPERFDKARPLRLFEFRGIRCVFAGYYFPQRYENWLCDDQSEFVQKVYDFKEGRDPCRNCFSQAFRVLSVTGDVTAMFMPCSTSRRYHRRFSGIAAFLESGGYARSGLDLICITEDRESKHTSGRRSGVDTAESFAETVKIYEQAKRYYDQLKAVNNLIQDARKVRDIILMVGDVSDIYVTNFGKMMNDGNFSPRELDAIAFGYARLLEESNGVLQDLRQVINVSTLSMTDKDRMDVVDRCYYEMRRYRNLVSYYTNKNIAVSYLRARKKNDLDRVMRLYGDETSKYW